MNIFSQSSEFWLPNLIFLLRKPENFKKFSRPFFLFVPKNARTSSIPYLTRGFPGKSIGFLCYFQMKNPTEKSTHRRCNPACPLTTGLKETSHPCHDGDELRKIRPTQHLLPHRKDHGFRQGYSVECFLRRDVASVADAHTRRGSVLWLTGAHKRRDSSRMTNRQIFTLHHARALDRKQTRHTASEPTAGLSQNKIK